MSRWVLAVPSCPRFGAERRSAFLSHHSATLPLVAAFPAVRGFRSCAAPAPNGAGRAQGRVQGFGDDNFGPAGRQGCEGDAREDCLAGSAYHDQEEVEGELGSLTESP